MIHQNGKTRDTMTWHFPHGVAQESTIRENGWKLIYNYMPGRSQLQLFQLYDDYPENPRRVDIEESKNLADQFPEKSRSLKEKTFLSIIGNECVLSFLNPSYKGTLPNKEMICVPHKQGRRGREVWAEFKTKVPKYLMLKLLTP